MMCVALVVLVVSACGECVWCGVWRAVRCGVWCVVCGAQCAVCGVCGACGECARRGLAWSGVSWCGGAGNAARRGLGSPLDRGEQPGKVFIFWVGHDSPTLSPKLSESRNAPISAKDIPPVSLTSVALTVS